MNDISKNPFLIYMKKKGVVQREFELKTKEIDIKLNIINQLRIISEFHKKSMGYNDYIGYRLEDKRGRTLEQYKIYLKRTIREYEYIKENSPKNKFEELVLKYGEENFKKAERAIRVIYDNGYLDIIRRSMNRNEVCLGNSYFNNIRKTNVIEILELEKCFYDLVEIDAINFFRKLIKKKIKVDYNDLVGEFCEFEGLDNKSLVFLKALISYPFEFMKCCSKYIINTRYKLYEKDLDIYKIEKKLKKAIICDSSMYI